MKVFVTLLGALALMAMPAAAQETTLIFATGNAPQAHLNLHFFHPWADKVNEQGKGILRIDVRDGTVLANGSNFYNRVLDDVVQISFGQPTQVSGKFPLSEGVALPQISDNSEFASIAYWRLYKSGLLDKEFDEVVPLFLCVFPPVGIHLAKAPRTLDPLEGLKLGVSSKLTSEATRRLGGTPLAMPLMDYYESVQRGAINGVVTAWAPFQPFRLIEVTTYHVEARLGGGPTMLFMAKKRYDALPAAARQILDANSGEPLSRAFGVFSDQVQDDGRKLATGNPAKHTVVYPTPEQNAKWHQALAPLEAEWVKNTPGGDKMLAAYRQYLADATAGR